MLNKYFPFLNWIQELKDPQVLRADMIAGLTVALVLIPQSMAYATLAGLPEVYGLYIAFVPVFVAALWGSSRQLGTGPVAVVSTMTATTLAPIVILALGPGYSQEEYLALYIPTAMFLTLLVGLFQFALGAFKLGAIVNFLSHPVIVGFTNAAALFIGLTQVSKIFGVDMPGGASDHFLTIRIWGVLQNLNETHVATLIMGIAAFAIMIGMKRFLPKYPGVLVAVVGTTLASYLIGFEENLGGKVVGTIPEGLPGFAMPAFSFESLFSLLIGAIIIGLVGFMEAISIAKAMAAKTKDRIDPNQELMGQGLANIAGSFFQSYPASGSFSRSAVNFNAGAKTGFSSVVTALIVVITLLFLTPLLYHLPKATLAAVVIMAVFGLINFKSIKHIWRTNKHDGVAAMVTFIATIGTAPKLDHGIIIGAVLAIVLYLYRTMRPRVAVLGRYMDGTLRDVEVNKGIPTDENIIAVRFDGSLYFANISYFEDAMLKAVADHPDAKYLLVVSDAINEIDASGEEVLHQFVHGLNENQITVVFSGLKKQVLDVMRATKLYDLIGEQNIFSNEDFALDAIYERLGMNASGAVCPLKRQPIPA